jgi:lipoprotein-anchoring transpeptidase ErfK/SrfK
MIDKLTGAQQLLEQARLALYNKDIQTARRLTQQATRVDPNCREAWLFMADLSHGTAQKAYLKQAESLPPSNSAEPTRKVSPVSVVAFPRKQPRLFLILAIAILIVTALVALLAWMIIPAQYSVSAIDHSSQRIYGDLPKPSLTPTETPVPSPTATATVTPKPTETATMEPTSTTSSQYIDPIPTPEIPIIVTDDSRWIDVNLTNQRTYAYEGSDLIRTFIVSTGTYYYPTVTGQYHIYVKYRYDDMSGPGYSLPDVPYTMYFYKGYSFHGTYWHNNFGVPMSHGCINMTIADSMWLYNWASVGTLVNIHY